MDCPLCLWGVSLEGLGAHIASAHVGSANAAPLWVCRPCRFTGAHFSEIAAHCVATGHSARDVELKTSSQNSELLAVLAQVQESLKTPSTPAERPEPTPPPPPQEAEYFHFSPLRTSSPPRLHSRSEPEEVKTETLREILAPTETRKRKRPSRASGSVSARPSNGVLPEVAAELRRVYHREGRFIREPQAKELGKALGLEHKTVVGWFSRERSMPAEKEEITRHNFNYQNVYFLKEAFRVSPELGDVRAQRIAATAELSVSTVNDFFEQRKKLLAEHEQEQLQNS